MEFEIEGNTIDLNKIAPFYFIVDANLTIKHSGKSFDKLMLGIDDKFFLSVFQLVRPWNLILSVESLKEYTSQIFILRFKHINLLYRAQCIALQETNSFLFIGSPWVKDTDELTEHNLSILDFALNDSSIDMIQLMKLNEISFQETKELNNILNTKKKSLEEKEQLYRSLVENASDIIFRCDADGRLIFSNKAIHEITGYQEEELAGKLFTSFIDPSFQKNIQESFEEFVLHGDLKVSFEYPILTKFGKSIWLSQSIIAILEDKKIMGYSSVAVDITARKELEDAMVMARQKAEESSRLKERFLANTSHEIRTPMNAIIGLSNLLSSTDLNIRQKEYLNAIQSSAENLLVVINDILDISKIESEKLEIETIDFNLRDKLHLLVRTLQIKATDKNLVLSMEWDQAINPIIKGDPFRLNQILTNLISNAIKFTDVGSVQLSVKLVEKERNVQQIKFSIKDTGIGIQKENIEKIFDNFIQADVSISRKFGGTGLGLTISRKLAELMGGTIDVCSEPGKGSEFNLRLPFEFLEGSTLSNNNVAMKEAGQLSGKNILLVEDNEFNQLLAVSILEQWEVFVDVAQNGVEAIEKVNSKKYDLILMDIQMPIMGGIEATLIIKNDLKYSAPVIALTANAMKEDLEEYMKAGFDSFVTKPFNQELLYSELCKFIG